MIVIETRVTSENEGSNFIHMDSTVAVCDQRFATLSTPTRAVQTFRFGVRQRSGHTEQQHSIPSAALFLQNDADEPTCVRIRAESAMPGSRGLSGIQTGIARSRRRLMRPTAL